MSLGVCRDCTAGSNSISLFGAFQLMSRHADDHAHDDDDDHDVDFEDSAFDEEGKLGQRFVVLESGQIWDISNSSSSSSSSSSSTIVIACNTHLFSNHSGDAVRLLQVSCDQCRMTCDV